MTRDMFDQSGIFNGEHNQEWLSIWVPYQEDIIRILKPEYRSKLERVSETEFKFSGKKFRFLISKDDKIFARTKQKMWTLTEFIDHYKDYVYEESTEGMDKDSYSYSQIIVQEQSYYESSNPQKE